MVKRKNDPTVSAIIPTYNRAQLVGRAVQSILNQTYQDFEITVVDDSSTDNTEVVVKSFNDERIRYIRHRENRGLPAARNTGIRVAKGKYIGLLDDDDEWLPKKLEKQIDKFRRLSDNVGVVYSGFCYISENSGKTVSRVIPSLRGNVYVHLLERCILGSPTPLIRKNCFQKAGFFDETLPSSEDWDMWIRLSKHYDFDFVPDILAKHHVHAGQMSADLNARIVARKKIVAKHMYNLSKRPSILSMHLKRLGTLHFLMGDVVNGRKYMLNSIKRKAFQVGSYIHLFLSLLAPRTHRDILRKHSVTNIDGVTFYD